MFSITSCSARIEHFLTNKVLVDQSYLFCFTETHISNEQFTTVKQYVDGWTGIYKDANHGLALCYNTTKVKLNQEFQALSKIKILPVLIEISSKVIILVLFGLAPRTGDRLRDDLIYELYEHATNNRIFIVGDFNLDQLLNVYV